MYIFLLFGNHFEKKTDLMGPLGGRRNGNLVEEHHLYLNNLVALPNAKTT